MKLALAKEDCKGMTAIYLHSQKYIEASTAHANSICEYLAPSPEDNGKTQVNEEYEFEKRQQRKLMRNHETNGTNPRSAMSPHL